MNRNRLEVTLALMLVVASSCATPQKNSVEQTQPYSSLFDCPGVMAPDIGTLAGDFDAACQAETLSDAIARWNSFIERYAAEDQEYEDGFHVYRARAAKYELARAYYIADRVESGDRLLRELQANQ